MDNVILVALITGLTAGGLSCFAVQGGLLSASIARQVELANVARGAAPAPAKVPGRKPAPLKFQGEMLPPILLFMLAKLVAYTLLGALLGALGSVFSLSPAVQGVIQLAIGVFLVGNALRMFEVHPIFRYFSFEPPAAVTRYIRRVSKRGDAFVTPLFLGALTVLIPCGVTQSMMAVAIGTGSPLLGAAVLFAFVVGTSPTFVGVSWLAAGLGGMFQKYFYRFVAVVVLALGLISVETGLVLTGSPVSAAKVARMLRPQAAAQAAPAQPASAAPASAAPASAAPASAGQAAPAGAAEAAQAPAAAPEGAAKVYQLTVENGGYVPDVLALPANQEIELHLVTNDTRSCSLAFVIPALDVQELLPETGDVVVTIPPQAAGVTIDFMCSMGMYTGVFQFK
ncbi:MAG: sulfite exporter TauE/SafE family protein [Chloroflexota bacterium]